MSKDITRMLSRISDSLGAKFILENKDMQPQEVFSDTGLLPAIARRADQLCQLCFGYGLGISFDEAEPSVLGVKVIFDNITPAILRLMCLTDVTIDLIDSNQKNNKVELDELLYD